MAIEELAVFPQTVWIAGQGMTGTRKWYLDHDDNVDAFVEIVAASHWPGYHDSIPVQIQVGATNQNTQVRRLCSEGRTVQDLGPLPTYNKVMVVATYALHRMTNCWPAYIPKPWHPPGTTLSLKVKGAGQVLLVTPAGVKAPSPLLIRGGNAESLSASVGTKIAMPIAEYHLICDRMTLTQVDWATAAQGAWDSYLGCVNREDSETGSGFLGAANGTLLFAAYTLDETDVADPTDPRRYRFTAILKHRLILNADGSYMQDCDGRAVGWNHDFVNFTTDDGKRSKVWGWKYIEMWNPESNCPDGLAGSAAETGTWKPRYFYKPFQYMLGASEEDLGSGDNCGATSEEMTPLTDTDLCR